MALVALTTTACGGGSGRAEPASRSPVALPEPVATTQQVRSENLGYLWPFTVPGGTMECRAGNIAVFTTPDGTSYALNDNASQAGLPDVGPLRAQGADGDEISLGSLLGKTLKLC
ncbi:MAG: YebY family protein [Pseudonocardia sp.]|nr:YebY family protein [Pseudonocardia sp.]